MIAATECLITVEPILVQSEIIAIQPVSTGSVNRGIIATHTINTVVNYISYKTIAKHHNVSKKIYNNTQKEYINCVLYTMIPCVQAGFHVQAENFLSIVFLLW